MTMTAATAIVALILTVAMVIPQAAYAQQNEVNLPLSSSSVDSCASDQLPASIDGTTRCLGEGECESYEFDGKEVKHCDY